MGQQRQLWCEASRVGAELGLGDVMRVQLRKELLQHCWDQEVERGPAEQGGCQGSTCRSLRTEVAGRELKWRLQ